MKTHSVTVHSLSLAADSGTLTATVLLHGLAGTAALGGVLAASARAGLKIGLSGALGAGKTELARSIAAALGAPPAHISSPTYVLESVYPVSCRDLVAVRHWDWYRLKEGAMPDEIADERVSAGSILLVEWPDRCPEWFAIEDIHCEMRAVADTPDAREALLTVRDRDSSKRIEEELRENL